MRTFEDIPGTRQRVPLVVGIFGPTGSGKTYSALRVAAGIQRVCAGDTFVIDTESGRALHYAEHFEKMAGRKFRHVSFPPPHGSLDYMAAVQHCVAKGATTVVIDSGSHEHEGEGGVLELHAEETKRLAAAWRVSEDVAKISAWNVPKSQRRRFINTVLQLKCNVIVCLRAKEKLLVQTGKKPESKGWMPICGDELAYEMAIMPLLLPGSRGVPTWESEKIGEHEMIKLPEQFLSLAKGAHGKPLDEDFGEALARWAAGGEVTRAAELRAAIRAAENPADLEVIAKQIAEAKEKRTVSPPEYKEIRELWAARRDELSPPEPGASG